MAADRREEADAATTEVLLDAIASIEVVRTSLRGRRNGRLDQVIGYLEGNVDILKVILGEHLAQAELARRAPTAGAAEVPDERQAPPAGWLAHADLDGPVHVWPEADATGHDVGSLDGCVCGPDVSWTDPESGGAYAVPLVVHHSLDGREQSE